MYEPQCIINKVIIVQLLALIEFWFRVSVTCVNWKGNFSAFYSLTAGVRQGGVLSPFYSLSILTASWIKL